LLSTEREYCTLDCHLRFEMQFQLWNYWKKFKFPIRTSKAKVHCKVFEDNIGALEITTTHKFRRRTKHINVKCHFFQDYMNRKEISIHPADTTMQQADYLTKAVGFDILTRLRFMVMGWYMGW
jgi:hypothetical protein